MSNTWLPPNRACQRCGLRSEPTRQQSIQWHRFRFCGRCWDLFVEHAYAFMRGDELAVIENEKRRSSHRSA
jgi:hypothetical protein